MIPEKIVNLNLSPIFDSDFINNCRIQLSHNGVLVIEDFLTANAVSNLQCEAKSLRPLAFFCRQNHNVYLLEPEPSLSDKHIRNLQQVSDKGCVPHDQIPKGSPLRTLYEWSGFKYFIESIMDVPIFPYADLLSSININYYEKGQQLGWHYDNASFAITLMLQSPEEGGEFEYLEKVRNQEAGDEGYENTEAIIKGRIKPKKLKIVDGSLALFMGRNSLHRVAPVVSDLSRILVTLNFNTKPGLMLSENARITFFGRKD